MQGSFKISTLCLILAENSRRRYKELKRRLVTLNQERLAQKHRHTQICLLHRLITPFKNAQDHPQLNPAIADKNLDTELERMKMLIRTVTEKVGRLQNVSMIQEGLYAQPASVNESSG